MVAGVQDDENRIVEGKDRNHVLANMTEDIYGFLPKKTQHDLTGVYESFYFGVLVSRRTEGVENCNDAILAVRWSSYRGR